jgi:ActR/RegA family two-component response regulator
MKAGNLCCGPADVFLERKIRSAERLANPTFCAVRHKNQKRSLLQLSLTGWGDLNLPDMSGYEVLRSLCVSKVKTPILILSGLAGMEDKIKGLGFGADDYMTKPFHKDELVARIHAIVRRSKGHAQSVVQTGDLSVKLDAKTAQINGVSKALRMAGPPSPETAPKRVTEPNAVPSIRKLSRPKPKSSPDKVFGTHRPPTEAASSPMEFVGQRFGRERSFRTPWTI